LLPSRRPESSAAARRSIRSKASCCLRRIRRSQMKRSGVFAPRSKSPGGKAPKWRSCARPPAWRDCSPTRASDEARAMLADVYNWFTEGFDTADLKDVKALLDELRA